MIISLELWQLITLVIAFFSCIAAFSRLLLRQFERQLSERFAQQDKAREEGQRSVKEVFAQHIEEERRNATNLSSLERDFLRWQADLPLNYVRREDYVRGQSVIEAKLDALFYKMEYVQVKGANNNA